MRNRVGAGVLIAMLSVWFASQSCAQSSPAKKEPAPPIEKFTVIAPIFGQLVKFAQPAAFRVSTEATKGNFYIREAVPAGQSNANWTEMITVTGAKGLATTPNASAQSFVESLATGFKRACPQTFSVTPMGAAKIGDHDAFFAVASCGSVVAAGPARSETAVLIGLKGTTELYSLQWAERGPPSQTAISIQLEKWKSRIAKLSPIGLCPIVPGEAAPYASCINKK